MACSELCQQNIAMLRADCRQGASVEQRARLEREERSLLEEDRRLKQYIAEDAVTVGTTTHSAQ